MASRVKGVVGNCIGGYKPDKEPLPNSQKDPEKEVFVIENLVQLAKPIEERHAS